MKFDLINKIKSINIKRQSSFRVRTICFFLLSFIVSLLLEITVFNYASYLLIGGNYKSSSFNMNQAIITGLDKVENQEGVYTANSLRPTVEFKNINHPVRTLFVDASTEKDTRYELCVGIDYTDSARMRYQHSPKLMRIVPELQKTKYTVCSYSGDTGSIKFTFQLDKDEIIHINGVHINERIPFNISFIRVIIITLISLAVYTLLKAPSFQIPYSKKCIGQNIAVWITIFSFPIVLIGIYLMYCGIEENTFQKTSGDQISQELVDAFEKGQVSLLDEPSVSLKYMKNPYDFQVRRELKVKFKWDHVFYNGKYYSYYGIAPVMVLFYPYHMLTGYYFPSNLACLLFSLLGAVFLARTYCAVMRNWFSKIPFNLMLCGLIIVLMSCGIFYCVVRPMFYEMSEAAGFMFLTAGLLALLTSGVLTDKKIRLSKLAVSAVCISLAVMSRPTLALYAIAALIWLVYGFIQYRKSHIKKSEMVRYLIASLLPYILFGSVQMLYNYFRFGSFFEFGIRYSLTINNFTKTEFFPELSFISLWNFLFSIPFVKSTFPFFIGNVDQWGLNGYYFPETSHSFGLFWRALPLFSIFGTHHVLHRFSKINKLKAILLCGIPGIVIPIVLILSTWESGHALRYTVDFSWQMVLLALAIAFTIYNYTHSSACKKLFLTVMVFCMVWSLISNFALLFQFVPSSSNMVFNNPDGTILYYKIARLLEFWS